MEKDIIEEITNWKTHQELPLTRQNFESLCKFEIPCIRIIRFANDIECDDLVSAMDAVGLHKTYNVPGLKQPPKYVGLTQFEKRKSTKEEYFSEVDQAWTEHEALLEHMSWDPFKRMWSLMRDLFPENTLTLAEEPGFGRYYAGVIRETSGGGTLHADVTRYSARDYVISRVTSQITWNFFASHVAGEGGKTTLYNRPYRVKSAPGQKVEIEGFDRSYINGAETHVYTPAKGDVIMFNSHNPHEWTTVERGQRRMGVSTYLGRMPNGNFIYWS